MGVYGSVIWVPSDPTGATDMAMDLEQFVRASQPNGGTSMIELASGETTIDNATGVSPVALGA